MVKQKIRRILDVKRIIIGIHLRIFFKKNIEIVDCNEKKTFLYSNEMRIVFIYKLMTKKVSIYRS